MIINSKYARRYLRYITLSIFLIVIILQILNKSTTTSSLSSPLSSIKPFLSIDSPELKYRPIYQDLNIEKFIKLSPEEKCFKYFLRLFEREPNWNISPRRGSAFKHDNLEKSQDLINLNIFNHCYMNGGNNMKSFEKLNELTDFKLDSKFYPYLSFKLPIFQHWTGKTFNNPNDISTYSFSSIQLDSIDYASNIVESIYAPNSIPFWNFYRLNIKNTGIVISIADNFVNDAVKLLKNLKLLENQLPIQFIYRDDLSNANKLRLTKVARDNSYGNKLQDIWFINISPCLNQQYKDEFSSYFNKLLAYAFNTFENVIILDTDVILFNNLDKLLNSEKFLNHGTYFFKDRNLNMYMSQEYIDFLKLTTPNKVDELLLNINSIDDKIWELDYFKNRYFHYMESGVVLVNREKYWNSVILSLQLPLIQSTLIASWGEKEHFWLSLLLSGYSDFQFDHYWAASVGNIINDGNSYKICSIHPSHLLSDSNELMWINSGILNCPKNINLEKDFELLKGVNIGVLFNTPTKLNDWYNKPITFEGFIIPTEMSNVADLNTPRFEQTPLCNNYMWCAYSYPNDKSIFKRFSKDQIKRYDFISSEYIKD